MREYLDFVITKNEQGEKWLFVAPAWSHLEEGDLVLIEKGNAVEVVSSISIGMDEQEMIDFVHAATGVREAKKLYGKVIIREFDWKEEE